MSFWAGAVVTNLFYVVPYGGEEIVRWVWGGLVSQMSLYYYLLPFNFITRI